MGSNLEEAGQKAIVGEVVHMGEQLILPEGMSFQDAITLIQSRERYLTEEVAISRTFNVFPWDGAHALKRCIEAKFGWAQGVTVETFFGNHPPKEIDIEISHDRKESILWGRIELPNVSGFIECGFSGNNGQICFEADARVLRKDEATIKDLFDRVDKYLKTDSIYIGKAIKIQFTDRDGDDYHIPQIKFMNTSEYTREKLIYSEGITESIETNLFTPIERIEDCIENDMPVKRGVLLGGPYGTGKTLAASVAANIAEANGVTYIYVSKAEELPQAIKFAEQYSQKGCVVFCEDIDRAVTGPRSVKVDDILNIIDGIDTKTSKIITVLTTNHIENINAAMLRPGRLDAIINVLPPNAKAVESLIRHYGSGTVKDSEDLSEAGELLAGCIPAVIAEVMKRAKLAQLRLQPPGTKIENISADAIEISARSMREQVDLLDAQSNKAEPEITIDKLLGEAVSNSLNGTKERVREIHRQIV
jgi:transitional endoplasmic reticulum ATPase